ncbi:YjzD family protein [Bacillaceae bacterium W0354]
MRYILTIIWSFLLSAMVVYVLASMSGDTFNMTGVYVLTVVFSLIAFIGDGVLRDPDESTN